MIFIALFKKTYKVYYQLLGIHMQRKSITSITDFVQSIVLPYKIWAETRQNLSSGFLTKPDSNQSPQIQRLARILKFLL